ALLFADLLLMEQQSSRQERIFALAQEGFDQGTFCSDAKNRLGCVAETLTSYPLRMGSSFAIEATFRKLRTDGLAQLQDPIDRRRWEDEYHLAICRVLVNVLKRASDDDLVRPTEIYARRNFLRLAKAEIKELEAWIQKIKKSYERIGAQLDPYHLDLVAQLEKLRNLVANESNRSEITNFVDSLIP
ncbi:hypothetical protein EBZ37_10105, partial [bacterium]|nr:hypothetical protein [bacterium]